MLDLCVKLGKDDEGLVYSKDIKQIFYLGCKILYEFVRNHPIAPKSFDCIGETQCGGNERIPLENVHGDRALRIWGHDQQICEELQSRQGGGEGNNPVLCRIQRDN